MNTTSPRPAATARPLDILLVSLWSGLMAGATLVVVLAVRRFAFNSLVYSPVDTVWMAPLGHVVAFLVPGGLLALLAAWKPRWVSLRLALGVMLFLGAWTTLLLFRQLSALAVIVLALGIAVSTSALIARRWPAPRRWIIASSAVVIVTVGLLVTGWIAFQSMNVSRWARNAPVPPSTAPNVLFLVLDTERADHSSLYGYPRPTSPALDRLASGATTFDFAIAPSSWTLASHASFFTGRWPGSLSARWERPLDDAAPTLAETLRDAGWNTVGISANPYFTGRATGVARGFTQYTANDPTLSQALLTVRVLQVSLVRSLLAARSRWEVKEAIKRFDLSPPFDTRRALWRAPDVAEAFLDWQARHTDRPFFAFVNLFDAHEARRLPDPWRTRFGTDERGVNRYDGAIALVDHGVSIIMDSLKARGVLDRTVVIVTADHGEHLGEHGLVSHGNSLYLPLLRVPLVIRYPAAVPAGVRDRRIVSLRDLPATVLELAGQPAQLPGASLFGASLAGSPAVSELEQNTGLERNEPAAWGPMRSLVTERWQCIFRVGRAPEVFDYRADTAEAFDRSGDAEGQAALSRCRIVLDSTDAGYPDPVVMHYR